MNRRWFGILLIVFGIILIGVFAYLFFVANRAPDVQTGSGLPDVPFSDGTPFETGDDGVAGGETPVEPDIDKPEEEPELPTLFQITDTPITGFGAYTKEKEVLVEVSRFVTIDNEDGSATREEIVEEVIEIQDIPRVRYHDMQSGRIFEAVIDDADIATEALVDDPINGMREALFADEDTIFLRYYDEADNTIATYLVNLQSSRLAATCPVDFAQSLGFGASGEAVSNVQRYLIPALAINQPLAPGEFDEDLLAAVKQFQEAVGLSPDGAIGPATNRELQALCLRVEEAALEKRLAETDEAPFVASGVFVDRDILQLVGQPGGQDLFALIDGDRHATGVVMDHGATSRETVYDLDFRDWIVEWPAADRLTFTTKSSGSVEGSGYVYDLVEKDFFNVLGGVVGLTMRVNTDGSTILASESFDEWSLDTFLVDVATRQESNFPVETLPEKCVWSERDTSVVYCAVPEVIPVALYPDRWYQNQISFDDALWRIDTATGRTTVIEDFREEGVEIDAINLALDEEEDWLYFVDKKTGYLWGKLVN